MILALQRDQFLAAITDDPRDKFAKTFRAKADARRLWNMALGEWKDDVLRGAIIGRMGKRNGVMNLELLHVFARYRGQDIGTKLMERVLQEAEKANATHFRVSSEPNAVDFYRSLGMKFWGKQKSGSLLCIFRMQGWDPRKGIYDDGDPVVRGAVFTGQRGSVVDHFEVPH